MRNCDLYSPSPAACPLQFQAFLPPSDLCQQKVDSKTLNRPLKTLKNHLRNPKPRIIFFVVVMAKPANDAHGFFHPHQRQDDEHLHHNGAATAPSRLPSLVAIAKAMLSNRRRLRLTPDNKLYFLCKSPFSCPLNIKFLVSLQHWL